MSACWYQEILCAKYKIYTGAHLRVHKHELATWVRKFGGSASIVLLDGLCDIFTLPGIEGAIGYRKQSKSAIVFGDPVCSEENKPILAKAFEKYCSSLALTIVFVTTSETFSNWALGNVCKLSIQAVEELSVDPQYLPTTGIRVRRLRSKLHQAKRSGISIHEYVNSYDPSLEKAIESVGEKWLKGRTGPQIYLAKVDLFGCREGKRWFYAIQNGSVVGTLFLQQVESKGGWLLQLLMTDPIAPIGTSEFLVQSVLETLKKENCTYLSFGVALLEELVPVSCLGPMRFFLAKSLFNVAAKLFSLHGKRKYWEKFQPKAEKIYILLPTKHIRLREILRMMKALNVPLSLHQTSGKNLQNENPPQEEEIPKALSEFNS